MGWESSGVVRFNLGPLLQGQTRIVLHILDTILVHCILHILGTILVHCLI